MKLVATKLEMETVGKMSRLVIDNIDAIASDLTVLDSRLLLGNANIDVVALDGTGSLVLIAINLTSDEQLLLKAVEAYSWCLEYPEAVRRLYPAAEVSVTRPPRVMFVVERMSDSFHRKVKQLGFPEVDCVEFRHLAIDGAEAVHFDTIVRLRRATLVSSDALASASTPVRDDAGLDVSTGARATSVKLQKLLTADATSPSASRQGERAAEHPLVERPAAPPAVSAPSPAREPGVVVSMMNRAGRHAAARLEEAAVAAKQPVMPPVTRRPLRDPKPITEPLATTVEPAAIVSTVLEMVVEPESVLAPEPVAVAPVLELVVVSQPIAVREPVVAVDVVIAPQPTGAPESIVATAPVLEPVVEAAPIAVPEPVASSSLVVAPHPVAVPEPVSDTAPVLEHAMEPIAAPVAPTTALIDVVVEPAAIAASEPLLGLAPVLELLVEPVSAPVIVVAEPEPVAAPEAVVKAPVPEPVVEPEPITPPAQAATAPEPPRISFADLSKELLAAQSIERKAVTMSKPVPPTSRLEPPASIKPAAVAGGPQRLTFADLSKDLLGAPAVRIPQTNGPTPMRLQVPPVVEPLQAGEITRAIVEQVDSAAVEPVTPPLDITSGIDAASGQPATLESLVETAAQAVPEPAAEAAETSNIQGLPGLKFPGDGMLTRQWMDFLNQMTATK